MVSPIFARQICVTAGAGFHHHRAGGDVRQLGRQLTAREFLAKHHSARRILRMKVKAVFARIDPDQRHDIHDGLPEKQNPYSA